MDETIKSLRDALLAQDGRMQAMQVINDALVVTLVMQFPALLGAFRENLNALAGPAGEDLPPQSALSYREQLDIQWEHLDVLQAP